LKNGGTRKVLDSEYSHRTKTPSPKPNFKNEQFKMASDVYSNRNAFGHAGTGMQPQNSILTVAASVLKFKPPPELDLEKENRGRGMDAESTHNQSNHSTIYAPYNLLSSSRKNPAPPKSIEALKKSYGSYLPRLKRASEEYAVSQERSEPDIDVMIKVKGQQ